MFAPGTDQLSRHCQAIFTIRSKQRRWETQESSHASWWVLHDKRWRYRTNHCSVLVITAQQGRMKLHLKFSTQQHAAYHMILN